MLDRHGTSSQNMEENQHFTAMGIKPMTHGEKRQLYIQNKHKWVSHPEHINTTTIHQGGMGFTKRVKLRYLAFVLLRSFQAWIGEATGPG